MVYRLYFTTSDSSITRWMNLLIVVQRWCYLILMKRRIYYDFNQLRCQLFISSYLPEYWRNVMKCERTKSEDVVSDVILHMKPLKLSTKSSNYCCNSFHFLITLIAFFYYFFRYEWQLLLINLIKFPIKNMDFCINYNDHWHFVDHELQTSNTDWILFWQEK